MPTTLRFSLRTVRSGFTLTELLVAATLLIAVLSVAAQLTVRTDRLRQDVRREQIALDELANQLDRILAADRPQRTCPALTPPPPRPPPILRKIPQRFGPAAGA